MRLGSGKAGWESGENNDISGMVASSCWGFLPGRKTVLLSLPCMEI
jgi:hypothetical protein